MTQLNLFDNLSNEAPNPRLRVCSKEKNLNNEETQALNISVVNGSFMPKESKCKYTNTLNDIHSKIVTYKDYWLFTEVFCLLHDNNDFCNCR